MLSLSARTGQLGRAIMMVALIACTPDSPPLEPAANAPPLQANAVKFWENNAALYWNGVARELVATTLASTPFAIRGYAILSVAQHHAAIEAERTRDGGRHASVHAAISAASVATLSYLFPAQAAVLEARHDQFLALPDWPGNGKDDRASGEQVGRAIGQQTVARAQTDNFFAAWSGTVPTGDGVWYSSTVPPTAPAGAAFGQARTFLLLSGDQFRPSPPPAFGSAAFTSALHEVRSFSDQRTPEQDAIAKFWHMPAGTYAPPGFWNEEAAKLAVKYRLGEREAAHVLALMNIVMYDGLIASHEAKYTYWLLRPSQADPAITTSVGLPNFPAYPSNHATISYGAAVILGRAFPAERERVKALAEEAARSRVFGGIHYRFDGEAGIELGRRVAEWALAHDPKGHGPFLLR